jgi:nucleotidyltransferase/DNA polymerase involved in DNA repair
MGFFDRITRGDLEEVKHGIELLATRLDRLQKSQKSASAVAASLSRRIKRFEVAMRAPIEDSAVPYLEDEEVEVEEDAESLLDREGERLRLGRGK